MVFIIFILLCTLPASAEINLNSSSLTQLRPLIIETAVPAVPPPASATGLKELTFMVFMNGKNSLNPYVDLDLNEMEAVGSGPGMNIVVQAGRLGSGVSRHYINRDADTGKVTSPAVALLGRRDMGDWKELADFVLWARATYPAKRYALVIWNHGNGWKYVPSESKGISYDSETGRHITTLQLGQAMRAAGRVDILATDACLMQMAEVAYEVRDSAEVIVGSEETAPGDGYPYDKVLQAVEQNLGAGAEEISSSMVRAYHAHYKALRAKATLSALRASELKTLADLGKDWVAAVAASKDGPAIKFAAGRAKSYDKPEYRDLIDILRRASKVTTDGVVTAKTVSLIRHIEQRLIIANGALDYAHGEDPYSGGISVYLPNYGYVKEYLPLAWTIDSDWLSFLKVTGLRPEGF